MEQRRFLGLALPRTSASMKKWIGVGLSKKMETFRDMLTFAHCLTSSDIMNTALCQTASDVRS